MLSKFANDNFLPDATSKSVASSLHRVIGIKLAILLETLGYTTLNDLAQAGESVLKELPGMGPQRIQKVREALLSEGLRLRTPNTTKIMELGIANQCLLH